MTNIKIIYRVIKLNAIFLLGIIKMQAQESISTTGGNASNNSGSISYTVGQIVYTNNTGTNGSITQGVQQPYEISVIMGIENVNMVTIKCSAFPNPVTNSLHLEIDLPTTNSSQPISYKLFNIDGMLLESKNNINNETFINMTKFKPAIYFLNVNQGNINLKIFKIIKR